MEHSSRRNPSSRRPPHTSHHPRRRAWCCSFTIPPSSPDNISIHHSKPHRHHHHHHHHHINNPTSFSKSTLSVPTSPQSQSTKSPGFTTKVGRRILSPGRVSPIDSDPTEDVPTSPLVDSISTPKSRSHSFRAASSAKFQPPLETFGSVLCGTKEDFLFDVRLNLKGKNGGCMVLELNSDVLGANSEVFAELIADHKKGLLSAASSPGPKICRIEVPEVENFGVFKETIELMFEDEITKRLTKIGVYRSIDILEVSAGIKFTKGVMSCLKYLEAVPWTEEEEEKLRSLFTRLKFDDAIARDILGRLYFNDSVDSQSNGNIAGQLVWSITSCADNNARNELKSLVKSLLCRSSVYEKNHVDLSKEDLYTVCDSCLSSLVSLFEEATDNLPPERLAKKDVGKTLIERISRQVDNINWLLEIMLDGQVAEDFVDIWTHQQQLLKMHEIASPMIRYELSRVSAMLLVAMGTRKLQCRLEARSGFLQAWFGPMLLDFGWLQRCRKGLAIKTLEEAMGQTLLTLPLKQQYTLFMEWFRYFSKHGTECPNLSKAFQIWWRRSFLRGSETDAIESR